MLNTQATAGFFGHDTSEVMPGNITVLAVNPSAEVYGAREAMWQRVSTDTYSHHGVLGQPRLAAMHIRRGDLLFTDGSRGASDGTIVGATAPVVFNSLLGLPFNLQLGAHEYTLLHNGALTNVAAPTTPIEYNIQQELLTDMLRLRYNDLRFIGIALSDWTLDDQRQSNAGIAAAASGTIATLNTTGHGVATGTLLCLDMPRWGDQFGKRRPGLAHENAAYDGLPGEMDTSGAVREWLGRPTLRVCSTSAWTHDSVRTEVLGVIRDIIHTIRTQVALAGAAFGRRMELVQTRVRTGMVGLINAMNNAQSVIDSTVGGVDGGRAEFITFTDAWNAVDAQVDRITSATNISDVDKHDAYLCALTEILRIHAAVWAAINPGGDAFFTPDQRFTDMDQAVRREIQRIRALRGTPNGIFFNAVVNTAAADAALAEAIAAEDAITPAVIRSINVTTLANLAIIVGSEMRELRDSLIALAIAAATGGGGDGTPYTGGTATQKRVSASSLRLLDVVTRLEDFNATLEPPNVDATAIVAVAARLIAATSAVQDAARKLRPNQGDVLRLARARVEGIDVPTIELGHIETARATATTGAGRVSSAGAEQLVGKAWRARLDANAANVEGVLPNDTEQTARGAGGGVPPVQKQANIITARAADIAALDLVIRNPANQRVFARDLGLLRESADANLRRLIRPWDERMKKTFARILRLSSALRDKYMGTSHAELLFGRGPDPLKSLIPISAERARVIDLTIPRLNLSADASTDPFLLEWLSLERSTRALSEIVRNLDIAGAPDPVIRPPATVTDELRLDPATMGNPARITAAVREAMYLYMLYSTAVAGGMQVPINRAEYFAQWGGHAGLARSEYSWSVDVQKKKWHELPLFKAMDSAEPGGLMRVTIIA